VKYRKSEYVETPHGNSTVWRYMAHWKLEKLLDDSSLFFPNATKLSDQYEVSIPDSVLTSKRKELKESGLKGRDLEDELAWRVEGRVLSFDITSGSEDRPIRKALRRRSGLGVAWHALVRQSAFGRAFISQVSARPSLLQGVGSAKSHLEHLIPPVDTLSG